MEAHGSGPPLVLSHGFAGSARNFLPEVRAQSNSRRIWLYDSRGHARSEAPQSELAYSWDCLISDFDHVVRQSLEETDTLASPRLVVGGLSLGAATALFWALRHPGAVQGLVLAAYPESTDEMRSWALQFATHIERDGLDQAGSKFIWGAQGRYEVTDSRRIRRGILEHSPWALVSILRQAMARIPDIGTLREELEQFRVPTLLVVGDHDRSSIAVSRLIADAVPSVRLAIIRGAGHVVNLSQPATFNEELSHFIGDL